MGWRPSRPERREPARISGIYAARISGIGTLRYLNFPREHWRRIRTNNPLERINREIRRRTRVVGAFPDGNSAVMLITARLRHISGTTWSSKRYLNMDLLIPVVQAELFA